MRHRYYPGVNYDLAIALYPELEVVNGASTRTLLEWSFNRDVIK
jgi:hypothetical protein